MRMNMFAAEGKVKPHTGNIRGLNLAVAKLTIVQYPSSRQRGCYIRTITARVQLENKITGRESQGACLQDELIGGKPPVVK
jgi:hypothetical protein